MVQYLSDILIQDNSSPVEPHRMISAEDVKSPKMIQYFEVVQQVQKKLIQSQIIAIEEKNLDADSISDSVDSAIQYEEERKCLVPNIVEEIVKDVKSSDSSIDDDEVQSSSSSIYEEEVDEPVVIEEVEPAVIEEVEPVVIEEFDGFDGQDSDQNAEIDRLMETAHECDESDERDMHQRIAFS